MRYAQTQCADRWGQAQGTQQLVAAAQGYLAQQGLVLQQLRARVINAGAVCNACTCPTGLLLEGAVGPTDLPAVLALGFTVHRLNRIMLTVSESNLGGVKAYANAGFVVEGRLRAACCRDGLFHDKIVMSILKTEWQQ